MIAQSVLEAICSNDPDRLWMRKPMTLSRDQRTYTVATDGHRIVELPFGVEAWTAGYLPVPDGIVASLTDRILRPTPETAVPLDLTALKLFIHRYTCEFCQPKAVYPYRVRVGGVLFNAFKFEPMVSHFADTGKVRYWQGPTVRDQATIDGGDWRFAVMPLKDEGQAPDAPTFTIPNWTGP